MKKRLWISGVLSTMLIFNFSLAYGNAGSSNPLPLIPLPAGVERNSDEYLFNEYSTIMAGPSAKDVAEILKTDLAGRFGLKLHLGIAEGLVGFTLLVCNPSKQIHRTISPPEGKEAYSILVASNAAALTAGDRTGLYWATRTLLQLTAKKGDNWIIPGVTINDKPRFPRRSLLVDPARNFISMEYLKRTVDLLADHKFNVLHLHLTDDQGWRFESRKYPKLHKVGGRGEYYTQDELRELVDYAARRGVEVLPEIDMPGHVTALLAAYPHLSCSGKKVEIPPYTGILPYALCPAKDEVYHFISELLREVADVFPGEFIHIGSDEVMAYDWETCPACARLLADEKLTGKEGLHAYFLERVNEIITDLGKRMIAWDEVAGFAPKDVMVQAWQNRQRASVAAKRGYKTLNDPLSTTYINYSRVAVPMKRCYRFDPVPSGLTPEEEKLILGGGASIWGNYVKSEHDLDRYLFPRLLAIAEVYWSPEEARDFSDFKRRLGPVRDGLEKRGVQFGDIGFTTVKDTFLIAGELIQSGAHMVIERLRK